MPTKMKECQKLTRKKGLRFKTDNGADFDGKWKKFILYRVK